MRLEVGLQRVVDHDDDVLMRTPGNQVTSGRKPVPAGPGEKHAPGDAPSTGDGMVVDH